MLDWLRPTRVNGQTQPRQTTSDAVIEVRNLHKAYKTAAGDFPALRGIDLTVNKGEFVAVVGKSGAGKSTLINMLAGIDAVTAGTVHVAGHDVHQMGEDERAAWRGQNVGVIFQFFQLLPTLTCVQNVMLPMDFANVYGSPAEQRQRALYLLDQVGIADHADKLPSAVSGGQRQRVAIARALANDPDFLAADEPTGNLDSRTARDVFHVFEELASRGKTILMVTHDRDLAARAQRRLRMVDGRLVSATDEGQ